MLPTPDVMGKRHKKDRTIAIAFPPFFDTKACGVVTSNNLTQVFRKLNFIEYI